MYIVVVAEMAAKEARLRWGSCLTSIEIPRHGEQILMDKGSLGKFRQVQQSWRREILTHKVITLKDK